MGQFVNSVVVYKEKVDEREINIRSFQIAS